MQRQFSTSFEDYQNQLLYASSLSLFTRQLYIFSRDMVGYEYQLNDKVSYDPSLYIINYMYRKSKKQTVLLNMFYILEGTIYPCPNLYSIIQYRLNSSIYYLKEALESCSNTFEFSVTNGFYWHHQLVNQDQNKEEISSVSYSIDNNSTLNVKESIENKLKLDFYLNLLNTEMDKIQ